MHKTCGVRKIARSPEPPNRIRLRSVLPFGLKGLAPGESHGRVVLRHLHQPRGAFTHRRCPYKKYSNFFSGHSITPQMDTRIDPNPLRRRPVSSRCSRILGAWSRIRQHERAKTISLPTETNAETTDVVSHLMGSSLRRPRWPSRSSELVTEHEVDVVEPPLIDPIGVAEPQGRRHEVAHQRRHPQLAAHA